MGHLHGDLAPQVGRDGALGSVLEYSDGSFNVLLEMGFGSSIRREWAWRVKNDQPLANLAAFKDFFTINVSEFFP